MKDFVWELNGIVVLIPGDSQELEGVFFGWLVGFVSFFTPFDKDNSSWKCFLEVSPWCFSSFAGALSGEWVGRVFPPPQENKAPTELRF